MSVENVQERVKNIIVEQLGVEADQVKPEAQFVNDLGADSLDTVELIMALEEEFDVEIPDEKIQFIANRPFVFVANNGDFAGIFIKGN